MQIIKRPQSGRGVDHVTKFPNFAPPPYNFFTNRAIRFKFTADIEDGPLLRSDHKTTHKWAWPRSRDQSSKFRDPRNNFCTNRAIRFKFGTDIEDGPILRADQKTTPKWAWPRSRDQISKFWDPLITFERLALSASNLAQT